MAHKKEKLQELIHHEVAQILQRDFYVPGTLITITEVVISEDGQHATVKYSVFPEAVREKVQTVLDKCIYLIQQSLNKRLQMRPVPKLRFVGDAGGELTGRIDEILRKIKDEGLPAKQPSFRREKPVKSGKTAVLRKTKSGTNHNAKHKPKRV
jgi:ribosome-binding factor A